MGEPETLNTRVSIERHPGLGAFNAMWWHMVYPDAFIRPYTIGHTRHKSLFHYTNLQGFFGIVENQGLWASHIAYLNDASEILHGREIAIEMLRKLLKKERFRNFWHILAAVANKIEVADLPNLCVCCFSKIQDDLSQWRSYGGETGVSLEIPLRDIPFYIGSLTSIYDVTYALQMKYRLIMLYILRYYSEYCNDIVYWGEGKIPTENDYVEQLVIHIEDLCTRFKNPGFSTEKEIRLVVDLRTVDRYKKYIKFRPTSSLIVPYCSTADFSNYQEGTRPLPIFSVMVGPSKNQNLTQRSVKDFLLEKGYTDAVVSMSESPYRIR